MEIDPELQEDADQGPVSQQTELEVAKKPQSRARAALAMRIAGATDVEIAEVLSYATPAHARAAYENLMGSTVDQNTDIKALRNLMTARLEANMKSLAPRALHEYISVPVDPENPRGAKKRIRNEEHLAYSQLMLRYLDRLARLQGLDAPQVVSFVTPGVQEFEAAVAAIAATARGDDSEEGDVFEIGADGETYEKVDAPGEDADGTASPY